MPTVKTMKIQANPQINYIQQQQQHQQQYAPVKYQTTNTTAAEEIQVLNRIVEDNIRMAQDYQPQVRDQNTYQALTYANITQQRQHQQAVSDYGLLDLYV